MAAAAPDASWVIWCQVGEAPSSDTITALAERVREVDADFDAIVVHRVESTPSGDRWTPALRAARGDVARQWGPDGPPVRHPLQSDLSWPADAVDANPNLVGRAEGLERNGDWLEAERTWSRLADGDEGPAGAYALLRCAIAGMQVVPSDPVAVRRLGHALARAPTMPEAALRLGDWYAARGRLDDALAWGVMADAVVSPLAAVPQLVGLGTWLVPATMATWCAHVHPERASRLARAAMARRAPPAIADRLVSMLRPGDPAEVEAHGGVEWQI